jgi:phosphoglycerol transferase
MNPMASDVTETPSCRLTPTIGQVFCTEWAFWGGGALFAFFFACFLITGSVFPMLSAPFMYSGDELFHSWMTQRVIEGWLFDNPRSGYPFGSLFLDYPGSDFANHLLMKLLGWLGGNFQFTLNLYFLLGFFVTFAFAYLAFRGLGLSIILSLVGAFVFDFLPFHFLRLGHLFYTWYFVVPVFFCLGFICFKSAEVNSYLRPSPRMLFLLAAGLIAVASFGVYNALFGVIVLSVAGVAGVIAHKSFRPIGWAAACAAMVTAGVLLNVLPNIAHRTTNGPNPEVAQRSPVESEVYALKMTQLIIPHPGHRNERLAGIASKYNQHTPLINENTTAALGVIGTAGLLVLFAALLVRVAGGRVDDRLSLLALLVLILFLFGTVGGLGALFANIVSPAIRGWNRISVFIGFGAIAGFLILLQATVQRYFPPSRHKIALAVVASSLVVLAFYDQTTPACLPCNEQIRSNFEHDRAFVQAIEKQLEPGAAVYQLPYMPFPEVPPQHHLPDYGLTVGFLHSHALHWSYGGMKGRPGDLFYRGLAQEPIERQIEVIKKLGFSGIYIDRRGYPDNGAEIVAQVTAALGYGPSLEHAEHKMVFFPVQGAVKVQLDGLSAVEIMQKVGYTADRLGRRHTATLEEGIDLTRVTWPVFLRDVAGLSGFEPWGRWSDANVAPRVRFGFFKALPKRFVLTMLVRPFGPNGGESMKIKVGNVTYEAKLPIAEGTVRVAIENLTNADYIELYPPKPISPAELGMSTDPRKLGVGFISIAFEDIVNE